MASTNRADLIAKAFKVLRKHYQPIPEPPERSVLDCLLYACCLENTAYHKADEAFRKIQEISFDWNEVRVTAASEIAESMVGFVDPKRSASNLRRILHSVFESQYSFDLENFRKQNLGKSIKDLEKFSGTTPFIVSYVTQHALAGHSIPIDRGALDVMYVANIIDEKERAKNVVPGLERAIPKKQGIEYASLLHQIAADLVASPFSPQIRAILLEINPDGKDRLPKRQSKKKKLAAPKEPTKTTPEKTAATGTAKSPKASSPKIKKPAVKKPTPPKKKTTTKKTASPKAAKKKAATTKKSPSKQLAKRKPR